MLNPRYSSPIAILVILTAAWTFPTTSSAQSENQPVTITQVEVGFDGYYKVGRWAPVAVTTTGTLPPNARLLIETVDPDGSVTVIPGGSVSAEPHEQHLLTGYFKSGRLDADVVVRIVIPADGGTAQGDTADGRPVQELARKRLRVAGTSTSVIESTLTQSERIWLTVGPAGGFSSISTANDEDDADTEENPVHVVALADLESLPNDLRGYDSVDLIVIARDYEIDPRRNSAIRNWVLSGGHLILSVGDNYQAFQDSLLADWVPTAVTGRMTPRDLSGLESFSGKNERLPTVRSVSAAQLDATHSVVLVDTLDGPILIRAAYGFGRVTTLGLDFDRPPLKAWAALPDVCRQMATDTFRRQRRDERINQRRLTSTGITEFASQLHAVQEDFPEIERYSSWTVMGLMLIYLLVIGPLDYLIVQRIFRRPQLTWVTFPLQVVLAAGLAIWAARGTNGNEFRVNQLDIVDIDQQADTLRATSLATIYSPESKRYRIGIQPITDTWTTGETVGTADKSATTASDGSRPTLSWNGIPENVFGGMYRGGGMEFGKAGYRFEDDLATIQNLPITIWSTKTLRSSWVETQDSLVESELMSTGISQLSGTITHHLPGTIEDWILAYGNRVFRPRTSEQSRRPTGLLAHQVWDPNGPSVYQRELKGYLTRTTKTKVETRSGTGEDILVEQAPYEPLNRDPVDVMRMLTFHEAAGGTRYTGLKNSSMASFDFTRMLDLDRAVLFGRIEQPAAQWNLDDKPLDVTRRFVFVRIVLPVKRSHIVPRELPNLDDAVR